MANEFYYSVSLSIVHPSVDPRLVTEAITNLQPMIQAHAGTEARRNDGGLIVPHRKVALSHWFAKFHGRKNLYSGETDISEFILAQLERLQQHRNLFAELRKEGTVTLMVNWFSESRNCADVLRAETLKKCGELGIDIELGFYGYEASE